MRSFALATFATLTFAFFCSAAPTPNDSADVSVAVTARSAAPTPIDGADVKLSRDVDADINPNILGLITAGAVVNARSIPANDKCLDGIITEVVDEITAVLGEITDLKVKITVKVLTPYLAKVKAILKLAIEKLKALEGLDVQGILTTVAGIVLDITGVAKLICTVIKVVIQLIQCVLGVVSLDIKDDIFAILLEIVELLCELLSCVLSLVGGVLGGVIAIAVSLLGGATIKAIMDLKLTSLIKALCL